LVSPSRKTRIRRNREISFLKKTLLILLSLNILILISFFSTKGLIKEKINKTTQTQLQLKTLIEDYSLGLFPPRVEVLGIAISDSKGKVLNIKKASLGFYGLRIEGGNLLRAPILPRKEKEKEKKEKATSPSALPINAILIKDFDFDKSVVLNNDLFQLKKLKLEGIHLKGEKLSFQVKEGSFQFKESKIFIKGSLEKHKSIKAKLKISLKELDLEVLGGENVFKPYPGIKGILTSSIALNLEGDVFDLLLDSELKNFSYKTKEDAEYFISELLLKEGHLKGNTNAFDFNLKSSVIKEVRQKSKEGLPQKIEILTINSLKYKKKLKGHHLELNLNRDASVALDSGIGHLNLSIDNLDLKNYSEFLIIDSNNNIDSGKLFASYKSKIDSNENIDGRLSVSLSQLNFKERGGGNSIGSFMSITKAVGIIKDENGKVKLDSKIEGKKSDPEFDVIGYLSKGIGSIIADKFYSLIAVEAAKRVAPLLLSSIPINPLNALTLIKAGYKFAVKPRFNDLKFAPHSFEIKGRELKTLERVVSFLKGQPEVSLSFCPKTYLVEKTSKVSLKEGLNLNVKRMNSVLSSVQSLAPGVEKQIVFCGASKTLEEEGIGSIDIQI
jgi:hypothetical protein